MYRNVLWIDPAVPDYQVFVDSVNEDTLALVYPEALIGVHLSGVERIGFVFEKHGPMALYLQQNAALLIGLGVKHMDFLACDTLPEWQGFYDTLTDNSLNNITVGASNNKTGNLQYGGDWLMESTCEDVEAIYFMESIEYYKYLLNTVTTSNYIVDTSKKFWMSSGYYNIGGGYTGKYLNQVTSLTIDKLSIFYYSVALFICNGELFSSSATNGPLPKKNDLINVTDIAADITSYAISDGKLYSCLINNTYFATPLTGTYTIPPWNPVKNGTLEISAQRVSCCTRNNIPLEMIYLSDGVVYKSNHIRISPTGVTILEISLGYGSILAIDSKLDLYTGTSDVMTKNILKGVTQISAGQDDVLGEDTASRRQLYKSLDLAVVNKQPYKRNRGSGEFTLLSGFNNVTRIGSYGQNAIIIDTNIAYSSGIKNDQILSRIHNQQSNDNHLFLPCYRRLGTTVNGTIMNTAMILSDSYPPPDIVGLLVTSIEKTVAAINTSVNIYGYNFSTSNTSYLYLGDVQTPVSIISSDVLQFRVPVLTSNVSVQLYTSTGAIIVEPSFSSFDYYATCYFGYFKPASNGNHQFNLSAKDLVQLRIGNQTLFDLRSTNTSLFQLNTSTSTVQSSTLSLLNTSYYPVVLTYVNRITNLMNVSLAVNVSFGGSFKPLIPYCTLDRNVSGLYFYNLSRELLDNTMGVDFLPLETYPTDLFTKMSRIYSADWAYGTVESQAFWNPSSAIRLIEAPVPVTVLNISSVQSVDNTLIITGTGFHANVSVLVNGLDTPRTFDNGILTVQTAEYTTVLVIDGLAKSKLYSGFSVTYIERTTAIRNSSVQFGGFNFLNNLSYIQIGNTSTKAFVIRSNTSVEMKVPASTQISQPLIMYAPNGDFKTITTFTIPPPMTVSSYVPPKALPNQPLQIVGVNFSQLSYVKIGGQNVSVTFDESNAYTTVPSSLSGSAAVVVFDLYGNTAATSDLPLFKNLSVTAVNSVVPGATVQITGTDFRNLSHVNFGGTIVPNASLSYIPTTITFFAPSSARNISIGVYNLYGFNASISYTAASTPFATTFGPVRATKNAPLILTGRDFNNLSYVSFTNAQNVPITSHTNTSFRILVPEITTSQSTLSIYDIYGNATSYPTPLQYATLTTSYFSPTIAPEGSILTLNGDNLSNLSSVTFVGAQPTGTQIIIPATNVSRLNDQQLTVTVPKFAQPIAGSFETEIRVQDLFQNAATYASKFIVRRMTLSEFTPSKAVPNNTLTLRGSFADVSFVRFTPLGTTFYEQDLRISEGQLQMTLPSLVTTAGILIQDKYNNTINSTGLFDLLPKLNASSMPAQSVQRSTVAIQGIHFADISDVYFGTENASFTYTSTKILARVPESSQTNVSVVIRDLYTNTTRLSFRYIYPQIQTFPSSGAQRQILNVTGQNLLDLSYAIFQTTNNVSVYPYNLSSGGFYLRVPDGSGDESGNVSVLFYDTYLNPLTPLNFKYLNPAIRDNTSSGTTNWIVTLYGQNLQDTSGVRMAGVPIEYQKTSTAIRFPAPANTGNVSFEVLDIHGNSTMAPYLFEYKNPRVTGIDGLRGRMGQRRILLGENLEYTSRVLYGTVPPLGLLEPSANRVVTVVPEVRGNMSIYAYDICGNESVFPGTFESLGGNMSLFAMNPSFGTTNTRVTLGGENLDFTEKVTFGENASILINTSTQIQCLVPPGDGQVNVFVSDVLNLSVFYYSTFTYRNPSVSSILPIQGPPRLPVTITGSNLYNTSTVYWGNTSIPFTPGDTELRITVPSGDTNTSIKVTDNLGNEVRYTEPFQYENPSLQRIQPDRSPQNASIVLSGLYLENTSYIMFGETRLSKDLEQIIPTGTGNVSVRTYDLYGNETLAWFTYVNPTITRFSQGYGTAGMQLFFEGINLEWISSVKMNGLTVQSQIYSGLIYFTVPEGSDFTQIELVNPYFPLGQSFEYRNPVFESITLMGREGSPGIIRGNHLQDLSLYLNDRVYPSTANVSSITFLYPARGTYAVQLRSLYTTLNLPSITSLGGPVTIQQVLSSYGPDRSSSVILGSNLDYTTQVTIGNVSASINYKAAGYVNVSIPPGTGEQPVTVYDIQNVSYSAGIFTYRNPNVSTMAPQESRVGAKVTITGVNLNRSTRVSVNGFNVSVQKTNTSVTFLVPDGSGNASVVLFDDVGNRNYPGTFNYIEPSILYTGNFSGAAGDEIVIRGTYLNYTEFVKFGIRNASFAYETENHPAGRLRIKVPMGQKQRTITLVDDGQFEMTYPTKFLYTQFSSILLNPFYGKPNASVNVQLVNFGNVSEVRMGPYLLDYVPNLDLDELQIKVPDLTGVVSVEVMDTDGEIMTKPFRYESIVISELDPPLGVASTVVFVQGSKFSTVSRVEFDSTLAEFTYLTDTLMKVIVPPDLPEFSILFMYDSMENLGTYASFQTIYSFVGSFTKSGRVGDLFEITGEYLNTMKAITFNGIPAKDLVITDTNLTCRIPYGITSPNIRMVDRRGASIDIALANSDPESTFTYLPSIPTPVIQGSVFCVATDKDRLYLSADKTVTSNGHIYTHGEIILGMVVEDSILYLCDGTSYIVRYNIATRRSLPRYSVDGSVIAIKRYQGKLYALANPSINEIAPTLTVFGDTSQVLTTQVITLPYLNYQGLAVHDSIYLSYLLPYDPEDIQSTRYGGVCKVLLGQTIESDTQFITGLNDPRDLLVVYPYLYVDGPLLYQYDLTQPSIPVYQTIESTGPFYSSLAYAQDTLYLANSGQSRVETIPAPVQPNTTVLCYTMTPSGVSQCLVEITGLNLDRIFSVLFDHEQGTDLVKVSTTYLSFRAPVGTGTPLVHLLDETNQRIYHNLTFTYENVKLYQCCPRQGVEQQNLYLFGENFENVREVYIGEERVNPELIRSNTLHVLSPAGSGVAEIRIIDVEGNTISQPEITFSYNQIFSSICFQRGTQVYSDQGAIEIQKLIPHVHTIYGHSIQAITATYYNDTQLVRIEPHALGPECPSEVTYISKLHKIFYQGRMIPAFRFTNRPGFSWVPYDGEKLYNVLLFCEGRMNVQGMVCETLDPRNPVAEVFLRNGH